MKLTLIVPCFNECETIDEILTRVDSFVQDPKEIIVVDDGSTDGTREILQRRPARDGEKIILHDKNQGKGAAVRTGLAAATGDMIIIQDADLEYDPKDIARIIAPILDGRADVVFGSRFVTGEAHRVLFFWHRVGNGILTLLSNMFTGLNLTDMESGYKAFRTSTLRQITIQESRFGVEPEITAKIAKIPRIRVYEVGISYSGRTYLEGKKIGWKDGVRALFCIVKYSIFR